jgi:hypothetical protein
VVTRGPSTEENTDALLEELADVANVKEGHCGTAQHHHA